MLVPGESAEFPSGLKLKIGVVLSGGQAPRGHNVISGIFGSLQRKHSVRVQGWTNWDHEVQICGVDSRVHLPVQKSGQNYLNET
ncbi:Pyrophosphate--fructose 6-phosphate 1-phosphotransferase subunit beta 2 [Camellia lanceoleosa]|uniref:Pyrophosphate--fructose 6-phosphate 1-phosphotransferase subunit beta 2 n=1 Tax=Camellia lanceoleosa TaxID=1840588 RepID=A0ACC0FJ55_9ERIC|nr:Pyrophosphate--fructose 6-phosphate 1-phosphotransferase subunit beta 2 [Camellia lanceoleosa]